jgi:LuxR family maltose regulon positive regulatory protein
MSDSFRFVAPEPTGDLLNRPRLLRSLVGRWDHRVTSLVAGAGLGKTTLLAQALAENRRAPRGDDVWIGLTPCDSEADELARAVATSLSGSDGDDANQSAADEPVPEPSAVAGAIWQRAPDQACLVLDDVHLVAVGSTGAKWLAALVDTLPTNGHVMMAGRTEPPFPLGDAGDLGPVLRLAEDDLRFSDDELSGFAAQRGVAVEQLGDVGGWPAMAELAASVDRRLTGDYLWEKVLEPLGTLPRHVLTVLCDLDGADDALASAAVGTSVDVAKTLEGVPLIAERAEGWFVPHPLWCTAPGVELSPSQRAQIRRRAVDHLCRLGRFDEAFRFIQQAELWDLAPSVLRDACLASDRLVSSQVRRWLALSPDSVRASTGGQLAAGMHTAFTSPAEAVEPLQDAAASCRRQGDLDGEMTALAQLGRLAWWRQDLIALQALAGRVTELERTGHPTARALAKVARAVAADVAGDDATVVAELRSIEPSVLDPAWEVLSSFLLCMVTMDLGETAPVYEVVERLWPTADRQLRAILDSLRLRAQWLEGRVDGYHEELDAKVTAVNKASGVAYHFIYSSIVGSMAYSHVGDVPAAKRCLDDAVAEMAASASETMSTYISVASACLELAAGDEPAASSSLRSALDMDRFDQGPERRLWRRTLPLTYILLPETRSAWNGLPLRGFLATSRDLATTVVALRTGQAEARLRRLGEVDIPIIRAALHHRFAAELAVGLVAAGRPEGRELFDALGETGRTAVREIAALTRFQAKEARALLSTVPAPPLRRSYLAVLGPQVLRRGGRGGPEVVCPDLRRRRVQALVAFLVRHRTTTRAAITRALWPELDEASADDDLDVALDRLLRLLEPSREAGEPGFLLRREGSTVRLATGEHLRLDVDDFDDHIAAAERAEDDGTPTAALDHYLAAAGLYRGELHVEVPEADWFALDRQRYRCRFVAAAIRAGQLLLARGDAEQAETVAQRALEEDPQAEEAHAVLVGATLARDDRPAAARLLDRCLGMLESLGVNPSSSTQQLQRRLSSSETPEIA